MDDKAITTPYSPCDSAAIAGDAMSALTCRVDESAIRQYTELCVSGSTVR